MMRIGLMALWLLVPICVATIRGQEGSSTLPHSAPRSTAEQSGRIVADAEAKGAFVKAVQAAAAFDNSDESSNPTAILDLIEKALDGGVETSIVLTEKAFGSFHVVPRFRELIREHTRKSEIHLTVADEPGERLRVEGVVRDPDKKPVAGALVYIFHTDASGYYTQNGMDESNPRIFGYVRTDDQGRFSFTTIRPGHYPDQDEPVEQHIHFKVTADGFTDCPARLGFADDAFWNGKTIPWWAAKVTTDDRGGKSCQFEINLR